MNRKLRPGDFWRICDRSGFRVPASETVKEWNGAIVRKDLAEPRHPQDLLRIRRPEKMGVPDPRPPPVDVYIGTLNTELSAAASAGDDEITVLDTSRFLAGDRIGIFLSSGDLHRAIVFSVDSATVLSLVAPLPGAAASGNTVINYTAVATASLE
jgi:hypothetical protein